MRFPFYKQFDSVDCGPACLKMVSEYFGKKYSLEYFRKNCHINREGVSLLALSDAAEDAGFNTLKLELNLKILFQDTPLPCILYWNKKHFVVLYKLKKDKNGEVQKIFLADPAIGCVPVQPETFCANWITNEEKGKGIALLLEPGENFFKVGGEGKATRSIPKATLKFISGYFLRYKMYFGQIVLGMVSASLLLLAFPFLTQSIVDIGIQNSDLNFIWLILFFQLFLFFGSTVLEFIQNQLLLHIGTRINISIISDFLSKLMRLSLRFFDSRHIGDIINRINDQKRVETFITQSVLRTLFAFLNFLTLTVVLSFYSLKILVVFLVGSALTFGWLLLFMKRREQLDYKLFNSITRNNDNIYELVNGMQEIKLNNFEEYKKRQWEKHQATIFGVNISNLKLEQYQALGSIFFTQLKNIIITVIAASAVVNGQLTLGMMLSISFIIGQMNSPIEQFIGFIKSFQNSKISVRRMEEVYSEKDEEESEASGSKSESVLAPEFSHLKGTILPSRDIELKNVTFKYGGNQSPLVLHNLDFRIPAGKITAIVGPSGSGKTTLIKLLLKFYQPLNGRIEVNGINLKEISPALWRKQCGVVMQEGFIFSDTIETNIVTSNNVDADRLREVCEIACIDKFIATLPLGLQTKIGANGIGLSMGQKQRILIARSIYKNPTLLIFDEATSSLDANNERAITENLKTVFRNKTVIIVAHRLSTVRNADQIIVMDNGTITESGLHNELVSDKGFYFNLIKNQLELGQ